MSAIAAIVVATSVGGSSDPPPAKFRWAVRQASPAVSSSWHRGCPLDRRDLRLVTLSYVGFDGRTHQGRIVVAKDVVRDVVAVFRQLHRIRYPIRRMQPIDRYRNSDAASMAADNTSSFNCRFIAGSSRWSMHAYGRAIDINPAENPTTQRSGLASCDRRPPAPGVIHRGSGVWRAFRAVGWGWGGTFGDCHHFSTTGT